MWGAVEIAQAQKEGGGRFGLPVGSLYKVSRPEELRRSGVGSEPHLGGQPPLCGNRRQLPCRVGFSHSLLDGLAFPWGPCGPREASVKVGSRCVWGDPWGPHLLAFHEEFSSKAERPEVVNL